MKFIEIGLLILNIALWLGLFINYIESGVKLLRKPFEYYMTCILLLITMSISYPQSVYYYVGCALVILITFLFMVSRSYYLKKIDELSAEYEKIFAEILAKRNVKQDNNLEDEQL